MCKYAKIGSISPMPRAITKHGTKRRTSAWIGFGALDVCKPYNMRVLWPTVRYKVHRLHLFCRPIYIRLLPVSTNHRRLIYTGYESRILMAIPRPVGGGNPWTFPSSHSFEPSEVRTSDEWLVPPSSSCTRSIRSFKRHIWVRRWERIL